MERSHERLLTTDQSRTTVYEEVVVQLLGQVRKTVQLGELKETEELLSLGDNIARVSGLRSVMVG